MPELPEVETTKRGIEPYLKNQSIIKILVRQKSLRIPFNDNLKKHITKVKIKNIKRRAKYIVINFVNEYSMVIHLGMTGNLRASQQKKFLKHDHIIFHLESGNSLILMMLEGLVWYKFIKPQIASTFLITMVLILLKIKLMQIIFMKELKILQHL